MKKIKKIFASIMIMVFATSSVVYAASDISDLRNDITITGLLQQLNEKGDFLNVKILKDYDGSERYYYLPFLTQGYLIYDRELNTIHEYSTVDDVESIDLYDEVYYGGALLYLYVVGDDFYDLSMNKKVGKKSEIIKNVNLEKKTVIKKRLASGTVRTNSSQEIKGVVPNYSYNPNGICGSTAAAMLLRWYDIYVNTKYVPASLVSSSGTSLIKHLVPYIDGENPGSKPGEVYSGIQDYCADQKISHSGGLEAVSADYIIGRVSSDGVPYIMGLRASSSYGAHWVTGYGYTLSGSTCYAIVNDGHGRTDVSINIVNGDFMVW